MFEYMLRAEWLNAAVQPGMAVVYRFSDCGLTGKSQFYRTDTGDFYSFARQRLCRELVCRDMRQQFTASTNAA
ncbi:hypothetical protein ACVXHA_06760 [Escherichia coli]